MTVQRIYSANMCHYHQHDELHPRCIPVELGMCDSVYCPARTSQLILHSRYRLQNPSKVECGSVSCCQ
jgi:hypothetical protein